MTFCPPDKQEARLMGETETFNLYPPPAKFEALPPVARQGPAGRTTIAHRSTNPGRS